MKIIHQRDKILSFYISMRKRYFTQGARTKYGKFYALIFWRTEGNEGVSEDEVDKNFEEELIL